MFLPPSITLHAARLKKKSPFGRKGKDKKGKGERQMTSGTAIAYVLALIHVRLSFAGADLQRA